ncbi:MAG: T9SS type A sorting domain-containing protein [Bacteroidales bacterium]|nr:T9SS type A sorting domain-containing protein [Candidatus Latescibacterota bacterium]
MLQLKGMTGPPEGLISESTEIWVTDLLPVAPNPFNPVAKIGFTLANDEHVKISLFDIRGRKVLDLVDEVYPPGKHGVSWEGRDSSGRRVSSGVYFARLSVGGSNFTRRMLLIK